MRRAMAAGLMGAALLAGCSDEGSGDGFPPERRSFEELLDEGSAIFEEGADLPYADPAALPESGSATYQGVLAVGPSDADLDGDGVADFVSLAGDLQLVADFGGDDLSGTATNFTGGDDEEIAGDITFSDGFIDRDAEPEQGDWTFGAASAEGTLTNEAGDRFDVVSGGLLGDFYGSDEAYAGGRVFLDFEVVGTGEVFANDGFFDVRED